MGWYGENDPIGIIAALIGAIILLTIYSLVRPKKKPES